MTHDQPARLPRSQQPSESCAELQSWKVPRIFKVFYSCHCKDFYKCWPQGCRDRILFIVFCNWKSTAIFPGKLMVHFLAILKNYWIFTISPFSGLFSSSFVASWYSSWKLLLCIGEGSSKETVWKIVPWQFLTVSLKKMGLNRCYDWKKT